MGGARRKQGGMSLVEVLVAMTVFVVAYLELLGTFPLSQRANHLARTTALATEIGQNEIDQTISRGFNSMSSSSGQSSLISTINGSQEVLTFNYTLTVSPVPDNSNLKDVWCRVQWYEGAFEATGLAGAGQLRWIDQETLVANLP